MVKKHDTYYPEVAAADDTLGEEGGEHEDEGMRIMLQASAALEVARIQRIMRVENPGGVGARHSMGRNSDSFDGDSFDGSDSFTMYTLDTGDA